MTAMTAAALAAAAAPAGAITPDKIPESQYVQATEDGHLVLDGERVRYWGMITAIAGNPGVNDDDDAATIVRKVDDNRRKIDIFVKRLGDMGYNLVRTWEGRYPHQRDELPLLYNHDYEPGDGSSADAIAYSWHALDRAGIKIWMSSTNGVGRITADNVDAINDPETAADWQEAMQEFGEEGVRLRHAGNIMLAMIDERTEALWIERLKMLADFPNKYKSGLRLGDDPQIVVWELTNENFPFRHFFNGHWRKLPAYFRNKMLAKWNDFLRDKYGSDEKLEKAWRFLLPGESLDDGTVMLAPLARPVTGELAVNDTNPAVIESLKAFDAAYTRDDFVRQRGADVIAFGNDLIISHKQRLEDALHEMGKSCRLSPTVYDSGNAFRIQSAYMHQFADAVSTCSYSKGMGHDPQDRRWPFFSQLDDVPKTSWDVPWFEQSTALNKPHLVYETNIGNRTKYRAEYPLRVAALACIQDWDIVCWHTYPGRDGQLLDPEKPFDHTVHAGFDYFTLRGDEVMIGALRAAGEIFVNELVPPAADPVVFTFGKNTLLDPVSMDYGKSYGKYGDRFVGTTYRYGSRVLIDPEREDDTVVDRHTIRPNVFQPNPIKPNDHITFDYQRACMLMDSPAVASYTGFFGDYPDDSVRFEHNDVVLSDINFQNDDGIAYPVTPEEGYCTITLASTDGQPLAETEKAVAVAMSTSFNTGYELDLTRSNQGRQTAGPKDVPPQEFWGAWLESGGKAPTLFARVGVTVQSQAIEGMRYTVRDWYWKELEHGTVGADGTLRIQADQPVFVVELTR